MRDGKIELGEGYRLEYDSVCWTIIYDVMGEINPKTGKQSRRYETWYHANLESALQHYIDLCVRHCETAKEMMQKMIELKADLREILLEGIGKKIYAPKDRPMARVDLIKNGIIEDPNPLHGATDEEIENASSEVVLASDEEVTRRGKNKFRADIKKDSARGKR